MKLKLLVILLGLLSFCGVQNSQAQGITTGSMSGLVTDTKGGAIPGATVLATLTETGSVYETVTNDNGRFSLPNMRVGGPYKVTITAVGFNAFEQEVSNLSLGQNYTFNAKLRDDTETITDAAEVTGQKDAVMNGDRTGASTNIRKEQFERLPTITRNLQDFTALTPQAGTGFSFGGRSNLYNNFTIDGATSNNVFGLSANPGGQSNAQPIGIDAIQDITVSIAPYDVRQGAFTGAGVNAVTRSGTNKTQASIYTFMRNQDFVGAKVAGEENKIQNFKYNNTGFRMGGAVIPNKLFFFINGEIETRTDPAYTFLADGITNGIPNQQKRVDLQALRDNVVQRFGYDPGTFDNFDAQTNNYKLLVKFDWNISKIHKFSIRYNQLNSFRDVNPSSAGNSGYNVTGGRGNSVNYVPFSSAWYRINNNMKSVIAELNSNFNGKYSNSLTVGYTQFRDFRNGTNGQEVPAFPLVDILGANGNAVTSFGGEPFTPNNKLNQDIIQINDNLNIYLGKHTVSVGTANEIFKFNNTFTPHINGAYLFNSISDFTSNANASNYFLQYSGLPNVKAPTAQFSAAQIGVYLQDEFYATNRLKITAGIRADVPVFLTELKRNFAVEAMTFAGGEKLDVAKLPNGKVLFSPRVGFNLDAMGNGSTQIRGGAGIFTGRVPFVWISNQVGNNGLLFLTNQTTNVPFQVDPRYPVGAAPSDLEGATFTQGYPFGNPTSQAPFVINTTAKDFKFPQVFRANLGVDQKLPGGVIATLEGIFTKDINAIFIRDANLAPAVGTLQGDGRPLYGGNTNAALAPNTRRLNERVIQALVLDNTTQGYQWSVTGQLQKNFNKNFYLSGAYTYTDSRDINNQTSATASSLFGLNPTLNSPNDVTLSYGSSLTKHRVIASGSYRFEYAKYFATTISFIHESRSGGNFSYTYAGDVNNDGTGNNDLMYVPKDKNDILLTTTNATDTRSLDVIWNQLDAYISQDEYLSSRRGQYTERNGAIAPWVHSLNLRILQDIELGRGKENQHKLQLSLEVINALNLIDSKYGLTQLSNRASLLSFAGYQTSNTTNTPTQGRPVFRFATNADGTPLSTTYSNSTGTGSRWQLQFGVRYIFN